MDERSNPYLPWFREYSGEMDGITAIIEGIGLLMPITKARFKEWIKI